MEFPFNCDHVLGADKDGYAMVDSKTIKRWQTNKSALEVIDVLGHLSAKVASPPNPAP